MFKQSTSPRSSSANTGQHRSGWVKVTLGALILAALAGSLVYWKVSSAKKDEKKPNAEKIFEFASNDIALLGPRNMGLVIPISGSLRPVTQAMVKSKVSGEIAQVRVREGEYVAAGQVLVSIDTADLKARHDSQMAMVAESRAKLDLAKKNEENNRQLMAKNFISQTAFDSVANSAQVSEANYKSVAAQAAISERALGDAQIRAPFARHRRQARGQYWREGHRRCAGDAHCRFEPDGAGSTGAGQRYSQRQGGTGNRLQGGRFRRARVQGQGGAHQSSGRSRLALDFDFRHAGQ